MKIGSCSISWWQECPYRWAVVFSLRKDIVKCIVVQGEILNSKKCALKTYCPGGLKSTSSTRHYLSQQTLLWNKIISLTFKCSQKIEGNWGSCIYLILIRTICLFVTVDASPFTAATVVWSAVTAILEIHLVSIAPNVIHGKVIWDRTPMRICIDVSIGVSQLATKNLNILHLLALDEEAIASKACANE